MTVSFVVDPITAGAAGVRGDHAVRARHPGVDRGFALRLLKDGRIAIDGARATLAMTAKAGSVIVVDAAANKLGPAVLPPGPACTVLWQGPGVVVVDKADGVAMHAGEGVDDEEEDTLSALLLERFGVEDGLEGPSFPGRLDRPTSGLVVACLSRKALASLDRAWASGAVKKEYLCIVHGRAPGEGDLEIPLAARRARGRGTGKVEDARTTFVTLAQNRRFSVLLCELHTGRTHQIRRHMKAIGHPIIGDQRYGDARRDADVSADGAQGLMLHAWRLSHDGSLATLPATLTAPIPERFRALLRGTSIVIDHALADTGARAAAVASAPDAGGDARRDERAPNIAKRTTTADAPRALSEARAPATTAAPATNQTPKKSPSAKGATQAKKPSTAPSSSATKKTSATPRSSAAKKTSATPRSSAAKKTSATPRSSAAKPRAARLR